MKVAEKVKVPDKIEPNVKPKSCHQSFTLDGDTTVHQCRSHTADDKCKCPCGVYLR